MINCNHSELVSQAYQTPAAATHCHQHQERNVRSVLTHTVKPELTCGVMVVGLMAACAQPLFTCVFQNANRSNFAEQCSGKQVAQLFFKPF